VALAVRKPTSLATGEISGSAQQERGIEGNAQQERGIEGKRVKGVCVREREREGGGLPKP
jgi:hypothetical protein